MRLYSEYIQTTQKEDAQIYEFLLVAALNRNPDEQQLRTLSWIKHYHMDGNFDLKRGLYDSFIKVLADLDVSHPLPVSQDDPYLGGRYQIPRKGKKIDGETREQRLCRRGDKRKRAWASKCEQLGATLMEIEVLLVTPNGAMEMALEPILEAMKIREREFNIAMADMRSRLDEAIEDRDDMHRSLQELEDKTADYNALEDRLAAIERSLVSQSDPAVPHRNPDSPAIATRKRVSGSRMEVIK